MKQRYRRKSREQTDVAMSRIEELFRLADSMYGEDPSLADRYAQLARRISMKYKVRIPSELKRKICSQCHAFLKLGANCTVRIRDKKKIYHCLMCGNVMRYPFSPKDNQQPKG
jgi:ribonuclease P protein subunit RPR2